MYKQLMTQHTSPRMLVTTQSQNASVLLREPNLKGLPSHSQFTPSTINYSPDSSTPEDSHSTNTENNIVHKHLTQETADWV